MNTSIKNEKLESKIQVVSSMETNYVFSFFQVKVKRTNEGTEKRKLKKNVKQKENKCVCVKHTN